MKVRIEDSLAYTMLILMVFTIAIPDSLMETPEFVYAYPIKIMLFYGLGFFFFFKGLKPVDEWELPLFLKFLGTIVSVWMVVSSLQPILVARFTGESNFNTIYEWFHFIVFVAFWLLGNLGFFAIGNFVRDCWDDYYG
ncbi:hypothetical protein AKJ59_00510 [candidate division MSBL1 archaeon SCGC-AAA385M02]|uniref:Uncharacterized protein n=1 Tax=candidate division MSBL1 archaeon SCGC-AAA385M02 TaxID=1698287 RepID=A0A133VQT8_9EURY|nr:hypothetical protein AKJ59_00510 [candidate division MSBL1 archaeon SCGC-AAA385M02]